MDPNLFFAGANKRGLVLLLNDKKVLANFHTKIFLKFSQGYCCRYLNILKLISFQSRISKISKSRIRIRFKSRISKISKKSHPDPVQKFLNPNQLLTQTTYSYVCTVQCTNEYNRVDWFWRKKLDSCYVVPNCFRTPIRFLTIGIGPTEHFDCYPKISTHTKKNKVFKACARGECMYTYFFKAFYVGKLQREKIVFLCPGKTKLIPFRWPKQILPPPSTFISSG